MKKYSVSIKGHRTSYSLEKEFQAQLELIAKSRRISVTKLITSIDEHRNADSNLSSELRLFVLKNLLSKVHSEISGTD